MPSNLQKTLDYLFHDLLPQASSWISVQEFVFDRTRAIRQDFTIQGGRTPIAVECHERIARFHILSLHESRLGSRPDQDWEAELRSAYSLTLDIAQLNKSSSSTEPRSPGYVTQHRFTALTTLMQYYDDFRAEGVSFPNEAEFRAYRLLLQLRDGDVARRTQHVPYEVFSSPWIQSAMDLRSLAQHPSSGKSQQGLRSVSYVFSRLLKEVKQPSTSFLMACLMETHFMMLRKEALKAMAASYMSKSTSVEKCGRLLGFESDEQTVDFIQACGLKLEIGAASEKSWKAPYVVINKTETKNIVDGALFCLWPLHSSSDALICLASSRTDAKQASITTSFSEAGRLLVGRYHRREDSFSRLKDNRRCCFRPNDFHVPATNRFDSVPVTQ